MKKITIITNSHLGEDPRLFSKIAKTLATKYMVKIISPNTETRKKKEIELIKVSKGNKITVLKNIYKKINRIKPNVIICVEPLTMIVGSFYKKNNPDTKLVYDCHEFFASAFAEKSPFPFLAKKVYKGFENFLIKKMNMVFTVNNLLASRLKEANENVHTLGNFPLIKKQLKTIDLSNKEYDFIYVGGISKAKGMLKILKVIRVLKSKKVKIVFLGKFLTKKDELEFYNYIKDYHLAQNVFYKGQVPHSAVKLFLKKSRFGLSFLSPNIKRYKKAIPLKLLEYMKVGLPVITNNFDILNPIVKENNSGFQIEFNTLTLKNTMLKCLNLTKVEYLKMSLNAQKLIKEEYNWNLYEDKLINFFKPQRKVLLFAYFFPPLGGPSVQRPCKMVKYFSKMGIKTDVITVKDIVYHSYDYKMLDECKADNIYKTTSLDPMSILKKMSKNKKKQNKIYFNTSDKVKNFVRSCFPIDDKIGWLPMALRKAETLCKRNDYEAVIATMGPYTSGIAAYKISQYYDIPLILDYRDHWSLNPYLKYLTKLHHKFNNYLEEKLLERAKYVSIFSETGKEELVNYFGKNLSSKVFSMYNGWDEDDFKNIKKKKDGNTFVFSYIGNFYGLRTVKYLIAALEELNAENLLPDNIKFKFVGNYYKRERDYLINNKVKNFIEIIPQVEHSQALQILMNSDALLLFISSKSGKGEITGKIFEYLRSQKPILAMIPPQGEAANIITEAGHDYIVAMENINEIKEKILEIYNSAKKDYMIMNKFSREAQYEKLISKLSGNE